jgi:murein DD-endopeptidase MepM/ murein hydrolase activator NlpD
MFLATGPPAVGESTDADIPRLASRDGEYVFPLGASPAFMSWTKEHWDGGLAVDIEAAPELSPESRAYQRVTHAPVLAVIGGVARPADNLRGGTAVVLAGRDGRQYYYAHLRSRRIEERERVERGEVLGVVGNTGRWTEYLEPHLHFSIVSRHVEGLQWRDDIHAAEWLRKRFGLEWRGGPSDRYGEDTPSGWPFVEPGSITADYQRTAATDPDLAGLKLRPKRAGSASVLAPLTGEVNVIRNTVLGLRVQVTNRKTDSSVILSGLQSASVTDGEVVTAGDRIGTLGEEAHLFYHYFEDGELTNPRPTLGNVSPLFN